MAIKEPRKFVTTDQGHADVLNIPITTLYENDQALAAQIENIKNDPAGNDIASKAALDNHISDTNLHVTAAKQATWNAAEGNAKKYTEQYAAPKAHTHLASDLPSASTQARGIVQLNTSTGSTATDQAATPSAVKVANDRANEAYSRADQAFTQASDLKSKVANAITGKGGSANSGMTGDQLAAAVNSLPVKRFASGTFNGQSATAPNYSNGAAMTLSVNSMTFSPTRVFIRLRLRDNSNVLYIEGFAVAAISGNITMYGRFNNRISVYNLTQQAGGFSCTVDTSRILDYAGSSSVAVVEAYEWFAFE
ncbi:tail fiber protein [Paenibacillus maysiensis]|uniref:tail fiber protein n=1 Tax=Paenibacillus maysiensis TaxID=1155954 RepID=UPI0004706568|nr:phage tail protein [Paenibacillus maysiensis]